MLLITNFMFTGEQFVGTDISLDKVFQMYNTSGFAPSL